VSIKQSREIVKFDASLGLTIKSRFLRIWCFSLPQPCPVTVWDSKASLDFTKSAGSTDWSVSSQWCQMRSRELDEIFNPVASRDRSHGTVLDWLRGRGGGRRGRRGWWRSVNLGEGHCLEVQDRKSEIQDTGGNRVPEEKYNEDDEVWNRSAMRSWSGHGTFVGNGMEASLHVYRPCVVM
jgi:hypothetical protein